MSLIDIYKKKRLNSQRKLPIFETASKMLISCNIYYCFNIFANASLVQSTAND